MKKHLLLSLSVLFFFVQCKPSQKATLSPTHLLQSMMADVRFLSDDLLEGREVGTQGELIASQYIASRFEQIGLAALDGSYFQEFSVQKKSDPHADAPSADDPTIYGRNVVAFLDNGHANTIILGAHYDHLGYGAEGSLYSGEPAIHNGADDNASGVALILALAQSIPAKCQNYNYLFVAFSGEEKGLWGSNFFVKNPLLSLDKVNLMLNFDMVGRLNAEKQLAVYGTGTSPVFDNLLDKANTKAFQMQKKESGIGPSDHTSFYLQDLPVLQFFTGQHEDYHKPSDDIEKINFAGMLAIEKLVINLLEKLDDMPKIAFTKTVDESQDVPDFKVTLGVVPDYMYTGKGMRIDGVRDGKTASLAKLENGDIVVKMGDIEVLDMMSYMKALSAFVPGEETTVVVIRDGVEHSAKVIFQ